MKVLPLLLVLVLLGCSAEPTSTSAPSTTTVSTETHPDLPPVARRSASATPHLLSPPPAATSTATRATPTATTAPTPVSTSTVVPAPPLAAAWSYPLGVPGRPLGDGFFIRHAYIVENTWYNPGYWHTGEDWYALEGETAGSNVYAVADGEVVYAGADYPGRVVIVKHADDLFSMYGHLDPVLAVQPGQHITRGRLLGTVLQRIDGVPSHLHFEIRTFLTTHEVNGVAPRYAFQCGPNCPPGPGYWPIDAPDLPTALGWRNPTHVIARRMFPAERASPLGEVVVATRPSAPSTTLWKEVAEDGTPRQAVGELPLQAHERFLLLDVRAGIEAPQASSAHAYLLWYRIQLPDTRVGWVQAAVPSTFETGIDGRPSSIYFNFYPAVAAP
jgi:murein DD-endopeptidase MepM/ murein hydrolase activator NlpD